MGELDVWQILSVYVLVKGLFYQILGLVASQLKDSRIEEYELEIQTGSEHEHVVVHFHFCNGT